MHVGISHSLIISWIEMEAKTKPWLVLSLLLLAAYCMQQCVHGQSQQVPCMFIFGGTLSDNGNNNNLQTYSRSNYRPYGIDFPAGPTGRFTNGRTQADIVAELLGFTERIPPNANTSGSDILKGVNYASGSAGILPETGRHLGPNINLARQIMNHRRNIIYQIATRLGSLEKTRQHLNKCLYYVHIGNNDYINNYFLPQFYRTSSVFPNLEQYANFLIRQYSGYIQHLQELGARKFVLQGIGRIGCTPYAITTYRTNGSCYEVMNNAAGIFNSKLRSLVDQYNNRALDSKFIFVNNTARNLGIVNTGGFTVTNASCCPIGLNVLCVPNSTPCQNRTQYVFWDGFSTTEAFNRFIASLAYNGSNPAFTYPGNIKSLVQSNDSIPTTARP